jgi:hypothetical protein
MKTRFVVFSVEQNRHRHTESRPCTIGRAPLAPNTIGDRIATTFTLFPPPLNGSLPHPLLFPKPKRLASMPPTNWPLDHRLPFPLWPYKRLMMSAETHHTPSPFASLRLKAPLIEAHRPPAPISTAWPTSVTPCLAVASNEFPYSPSHFWWSVPDGASLTHPLTRPTLGLAGEDSL